MAKLRQRPRAQGKGRPPEMNGLATSQSAHAKAYCQHALCDARAVEDRIAKPQAIAIANAARKRSRQRLASLGLEKPPREAASRSSIAIRPQLDYHSRSRRHQVKVGL